PTGNRWLMAEYAEEQLEQQLPELQQLTISGLLNPDEAAQLLRKRRGFEYRLQKREKRLRDYQAYAQHEVGLLLLLKHRRAAASYYFKRDRIEASIVQRLHRLHRQACYRFQERLDCWLAHARFCEQIGHPQMASKVLARMLQVHSGREDLWLAAADWHWTDRLEARARWLRQKEGRKKSLKDEEKSEQQALGMETDADGVPADARLSAPAKEVLQSAQLARAFLLRGLRVHKRSRRLLFGLLKLECGLTAWLLHRRQDLPAASGIDEDSVAAGEPAALVLSALLETFGDSTSRSTGEDRQLLTGLLSAAQACPPVADKFADDLRARLAALPAEVEDASMLSVADAAGAAAADPDNEVVAKLDAADGLDATREVWAASRDTAGVRALRRYCQLEAASSRSAASIARVRREFERLAGRLGPGSVAFWAAYLEFEDSWGDSALVGELDWRARKFLKPELLNAYNVARLCPHMTS
ncbi:hypothetical protein BOX15_Mlig001110g1, partial [Macrostomum lignano]